MSELKPCPFCGYEPEPKEVHVYPNGEKSPAFIKCKRCNYHLFGYNEEGLFVHWNSRPIEDALRSELDQLREQIKKVREIAEEAQGDWSCIEVPYAPEWTMPYRDILNVLPQPPEEEA